MACTPAHMKPLLAMLGYISKYMYIQEGTPVDGVCL